MDRTSTVIIGIYIFAVRYRQSSGLPSHLNGENGLY